MTVLILIFLVVRRRWGCVEPRLAAAAARQGAGVSAAAPADRKLVKPTPAELMEDTGTGLDYGTRPDRMPGYLVPNDRFYVRSHAPTPRVDVAGWTLRIEGSGVRRPVSYSYDELWNRFPVVSVIRTIECAGNRRVLLGDEFASTFNGTQWGRGAIGTAEWTGVRLRDLLEPGRPRTGRAGGHARVAR